MDISRNAPRNNLAIGLGWFSLGLGVAELVAPGRLTRALGVQGQEGLVRAYGAREVMAGFLTLSMEREAGLWSRVAGDGLDIATLMLALRHDNPQRPVVLLALLMVAGVTALDVVAARSFAQARKSPPRARLTDRDRSGFPRGLGYARTPDPEHLSR